MRRLRPKLLTAVGKRSRLAEALAVLGRGDEGLDHLRLDVVAAKLVQLREPEVVARLIGVAAEVAEVLHQHEGRVELRARERAGLGHLPERRRAPRVATLAEGRDGLVG